jgi:hypothetical protein
MIPLESSPKHTYKYLPNRYTTTDTIDTEYTERAVPSLPLPNPKRKETTCSAFKREKLNPV